MNKSIKEYFDQMQPGDTIIISKAKDPAKLVEAGKAYIDARGDLEFSNDWTIIKKLEPYPTTGTHGIK